jgi:hypothetical protein
MKMGLALGSWFRRRLDGRWQWIVLIGILAFLNIAQGSECYPFRIEPAQAVLNIGEKNREMRVRAWQGRLVISHDCSQDLVTVTSNESTGIINLSANARGITGECNLYAMDDRREGMIYEVWAFVEVLRLPMNGFVTKPDGARYDFGIKKTLKLNEEMDITVEGGVEPYGSIYAFPYGFLDIDLWAGSPHFIIVKAIRAGTATLHISDGGDPPDVLMLNFEVK